MLPNKKDFPPKAENLHIRGVSKWLLFFSPAVSCRRWWTWNEDG